MSYNLKETILIVHTIRKCNLFMDERPTGLLTSGKGYACLVQYLQGYNSVFFE